MAAPRGRSCTTWAHRCNGHRWYRYARKTQWCGEYPNGRGDTTESEKTLGISVGTGYSAALYYPDGALSCFEHFGAGPPMSRAALHLGDSDGVQMGISSWVMNRGAQPVILPAEQPRSTASPPQGRPITRYQRRWRRCLRMHKQCTPRGCGCPPRVVPRSVVRYVKESAGQPALVVMGWVVMGTAAPRTA